MKNNKFVGLFVCMDYSFIPERIIQVNPNTLNGIERKIHMQFNVLKNQGYNLSFCNLYQNKKPSIEKYLRRLPLHWLGKLNFDFSNIKNVDFIYLRKMWSIDGDLILLLRKIKLLNNRIKIIMEIPTYPYDYEGNKLKTLPLKIKDKIWRRYLHKYIDRVVTYSDHDEIFGIKTIKTTNAIDYNSQHRRNLLYDAFPINMIACANLCYWHGYDRAIEGLHKYYSKQMAPAIHLYIVGKGTESEKYKKMIDKYQLGQYVHLEGEKHGEELDDIYDICSVGLDSMGRHRSGVEYNSSLKGKEYCAKGLFIISGVTTDFDNKKCEYYYRIPADDSALDFSEFVKYYIKVVDKKGIEIVQKEMMEYAERLFDFSVAMRPIIEYIEKK